MYKSTPSGTLQRDFFFFSLLFSPLTNDDDDDRSIVVKRSARPGPALLDPRKSHLWHGIRRTNERVSAPVYTLRQSSNPSFDVRPSFLPSFFPLLFNTHTHFLFMCVCVRCYCIIYKVGLMGLERCRVACDVCDDGGLISDSKEEEEEEEEECGR